MEEESVRDGAIIRPISKSVVHRVCAGQVILDLPSAVKELVENSLDAGATSVEIALKDYGEEWFQVIDNGYGISPENFKALALKHHTSKLVDFSDLQSLATFGFRGEALSSLSALGDLTVETRTQHEQVATHLTYDRSGVLISERKIARQVGTTVTVTNLFSSLPVRSKEFKRNIRKEYGKLISLLNAYAIISTGVRFVCTNTVGKGTKSVVLRTQGSNFLKDNIITVLSMGTFNCLNPVNLQISDGCRVEGFLSKPGQGNGRNLGDKQYYFINGRPVDIPKVSKILNELYKGTNSKQYPIAILDFTIPMTACDINLTPDKRKVFLAEENSFFSSLREGLQKLYSTANASYSINCLTSDEEKESNFLMPGSQQDGVTNLMDPSLTIDCDQPVNNKFPSINSKKNSPDYARPLSELPILRNQGTLPQLKRHREHHNIKNSNDIIQLAESDESTVIRTEMNSQNTCSPSDLELTDLQSFIFQETSRAERLSSLDIVCVSSPAKELVADSPTTLLDSPLPMSEKIFSPYKFNFEELKSRRLDRLLRLNNCHAGENPSKKKYFSATIDASQSDDKEAKSRALADAASELERLFQKHDFNRIKVIGQFNLGFIVGKLDDDLYIVDQHAADEKYNFERLCESTILNQQPLLRPIQLELFPEEEIVASLNMDIIRKNGFSLEENLEAAPGLRFKLKALPFSKNITFGVEDVKELIGTLADSHEECSVMGSYKKDTHDSVCPSRVRAMLASRACRSSVMIGDALARKEMEKIVRHLADLNSPWNCPHGRPTMRHLCDLASLYKKCEDDIDMM